MEYDFFVSYASEDDARALELVDSLRQSGYRCFYDRAGIPGGAQSYRGVLADAICDAETILVLLSPHSQASLEVRDEVQLATNHGRRKAAVSLPGEVTFTSRALELLLTSVQVITWGDRAVADVVSDVGAQRTLNQLRSQLGDYASITDKMRLDFAGIFVAVEADQREEAARHVAEVTRSLLSDLWHEYRPADIPPPDRIEHLIKGCRDHFETSEMTKAFTRVQGLLAAAGLKVPTLDSIRECLEQLVRVLSFLRSRRHIDADIAPELRADANFLSGLLLAAGWIVGEEIVPSPDTVYLLGEKPTVAGKRYLEVVLGRDPRSIHALAATAAGGILRPTDGPATTRFLVCGEGPDEVGEEWPVLSLATFVDRLTGFSNGWPPEIELRRDRGAESLARRQNAFIYGATRTGKTALLGHLSRGDWPDRPRYTAYIDLAVGAQSDPLTRFQESLEGHFPEHVRSRSERARIGPTLFLPQRAVGRLPRRA